MSPGRGSHVTDGKPDLSTLKISFPWETQYFAALEFADVFGPRASSTKTRIETPMSPGRGSHVTDGKPDLSTLKISFPWETFCRYIPKGPTAPSPRASSTKTRIETSHDIAPYLEFIVMAESECSFFQGVTSKSPRASSTKTRIETPMSPGRGSHVTDGKPDLSTLKISFPWETYLKAWIIIPVRAVRERVPRKQGLKPSTSGRQRPGRAAVRERVPRKQGLKRP